MRPKFIDKTWHGWFGISFPRGYMCPAHFVRRGSNAHSLFIFPFVVSVTFKDSIRFIPCCYKDWVVFHFVLACWWWVFKDIRMDVWPAEHSIQFSITCRVSLRNEISAAYDFPSETLADDVIGYKPHPVIEFAIGSRHISYSRFFESYYTYICSWSLLDNDARLVTISSDMLAVVRNRMVIHYSKYRSISRLDSIHFQCPYRFLGFDFIRHWIGEVDKMLPSVMQWCQLWWRKWIDDTVVTVVTRWRPSDWHFASRNLIRV